MIAESPDTFCVKATKNLTMPILCPKLVPNNPSLLSAKTKYEIQLHLYRRG